MGPTGMTGPTGDTGIQLTLNGYWGPTVGNSGTQTIYLQKSGNDVTVVAPEFTPVSTMSATNHLTYSATIPVAFVEANVNRQMIVHVSIQNPVGSYVTGRVVMQYNPIGIYGELFAYPDLIMNTGNSFTTGTVVSIPCWSTTWRAV
jgi:hypothetical protein